MFFYKPLVLVGGQVLEGGYDGTVRERNVSYERFFTSWLVAWKGRYELRGAKVDASLVLYLQPGIRTTFLTFAVSQYLFLIPI